MRRYGTYGVIGTARSYRPARRLSSHKRLTSNSTFRSVICRCSHEWRLLCFIRNLVAALLLQSNRSRGTAEPEIIRSSAVLVQDALVVVLLVVAVSALLVSLTFMDTASTLTGASVVWFLFGWWNFAPNEERVRMGIYMLIMHVTCCGVTARSLSGLQEKPAPVYRAHSG
jgi:hypothetical protein